MTPEERAKKISDLVCDDVTEQEGEYSYIASDECVKAVASQIREAENEAYNRGQTFKNTIFEECRIARREAIEEAAKLVENYDACGYFLCHLRDAVKIRSLLKEETAR